MTVSIIAAMGRNREIGKDNNLIWHLPRDMNFFKSTTRGHVVIMGRKNYESIPEKFRPLPGRTNIVITRNKRYKAPDCEVAYSLKKALEIAQGLGEKEAFIIGGGQVYEEALKSGWVDKMYLTLVDGAFEADVFFPDFDPEGWRSEIVMEHEKEEKNPYNFTVFEFNKI